MPHLPLEGWTLHFQRLGEGTDVVLLHGLSGDLASWHPEVISGLAARHRVTLVDLRGHGRSGRPRQGYTTRDLADDVARLVDSFDGGPVHIVGHSYGGAVALHTAILRGPRVASLVLADTRVRALQPEQGLRGGGAWGIVRDRLAAHGITIPDEVLDSDLGILNVLARYRLEGRLEGLRQEGLFIPFVHGSKHRAEAWLRLTAETTAMTDFADTAGLTRDALARIDRPALLVYGERSHCLPSRDALAAILPRSETVLAEGAGHFHPFVKPRFFLDTVAPFLARAEGGRAAAHG